MNIRPADGDRLIGNAELHALLNKYDPLVPPTQAHLALLEARLLAEVSSLSPRAGFMQKGNPRWLGQSDWSTGAAILAVLLIVLAGYMVDRGAYDGEAVASLATENPPTLLALAEGDPVSQSLLSKTLLGGNDDNE